MGLEKPDIQAHVHGLCTELKRGLKGRIASIDVRTPLSTELSSGIVCFDVPAVPADVVVDRLLKDHQIIATVSGFDTTTGRTHARLSPAIYNDRGDVQKVIEALVEIVGSPRAKALSS